MPKGKETTTFESAFLRAGTSSHEVRDQRPATLWWWNDALDSGEIRRQVRLMASAHLGGFVIVPREGLETPVLGEEWLDAVETAVDAARREGLTIWFHDGGDDFIPYLLAARPPDPGLFRKALRCEEMPSLSTAIAEVTEPDSAATAGLAPSPQDDTVALYRARRSPEGLVEWDRIPPDTDAAKPDSGGVGPALEVPGAATGLQVPGPGPTDTAQVPSNTFGEVEIQNAQTPAGDGVGSIEDSASNGAANAKQDLTGSPESGQEFFLRLYWERTGPVDLLEPRASRALIDAAYEVYYREFGEEFGRTIRGFLTTGRRLDAIPWSTGLPPLFHELYGGDILDILPHLFYDSPAAPLERKHFQETVEAARERSYWRPLRDWCARRDVVLAGMPEEREGKECASEGLLPQILQGAPAVMWPALPGTVRDDNRAAMMKAVVSRARQVNGRAVGVLSASSGWETHQEWLHGDAGILTALGADFLLPGPVLYSIRGGRKRCGGGAVSLQQPWWADYQHWLDTAARISFLAQSGQTIGDIMVLCPDDPSALESVAILAGDETPARPTTSADLTAAMTLLCRTLAEAGIDFDLVSEARIFEAHLKAEAGIEQGQARIGNRLYRSILVPDGFLISPASEEFLIAFLNAGGLVVAAGEASHRAGLLSREGLESAQNIRRAPLRADALLDVLAVVPSPAATHAHERANILYRRLDVGRYQFVLASNPSADRDVQVEVVIPGDGRMEQWDFASGLVTPVSAEARQRAVDGRETAGTVVVPASSLIAVGLDTARPRWQSRIDPELSVERVKALDSWELELESPNVARLERCSLKLEGRPWLAETTLAEVSGLVGRAPTGSMSLRFVVHLEPSVRRKGLMLVVEEPERWTITINGDPVSRQDRGFWLDPALRMLDVSRLMRPGENILMLQGGPGGPAARPTGTVESIARSEIEPVFLLGSFGVSEAQSLRLEALPVRVNGGNLRRQGLPYYPGVVRLRGTVVLPRHRDARVVLEMDRPSAAVARVEVNRHREESPLIPPYRRDVTEAVKAGKNKIVIELTGDCGSLFNQAGAGATESLERAQLGIGSVRIVFMKTRSGRADDGFDERGLL